MNNIIFSSVKKQRSKRNNFDMRHTVDMTCNMGELVPVMCEEVLPGDSWKINSEVMMRMLPLAAPIMHRVNARIEFFFVPTRLIWDEFKDFITGGRDGLQAPVMPQLTLANMENYLDYGMLPDHLGVQVDVEDYPETGTVSALPFRAYQKIYHDFYRDPTLDAEFEDNYSVDSGVMDISQTALLCTKRNRCWEKDYFTSALTTPQRGAEIELPLGDSAPLNIVTGQSQGALVRDLAGNMKNTAADHNLAYSDNNTVGDSTIVNADSNDEEVIIDPNGTLEADLSAATAATVEDLRVATRLQRWLERNMRAGYRYIEQMLSHFGVVSSDARLDRTEFLGGGKFPVVISEVLQTSKTEELSEASPQGNMAGHGIGVGNAAGFKKFFEEHGYIIGIFSVMPRTKYMQGTRRHFFKTDKFDFAWPEFAHLGEQPVYDGELYHSSTTDLNGATHTFGYQSRYSEYKFIPSSVRGQFKSTLDFWHMSRKWNALGGQPVLNSNFVHSDPTHRVFADTNEDNDKLMVSIFHNATAMRLLPVYGTPML